MKINCYLKNRQYDQTQCQVCVKFERLWIDKEYPAFVEISDYFTQLFFNTITELKSLHYIAII